MVSGFTGEEIDGVGVGDGVGDAAFPTVGRAAGDPPTAPEPDVVLEQAARARAVAGNVSRSRRITSPGLTSAA
jgi:hypothetical protein